MAKLIHIVKKGLSYSTCLKDIKVILDDPFKDHLEIRIEKMFSEIDLKMYTNLNMSYFVKEV